MDNLTMQPDTINPRPLPAHGRTLALAWIVTLSVSVLPDILWQSAAGTRPAWLLTARLAILGSVVAAGLAWKGARLLRDYALLLAALLLIEALRGLVGGSDAWRRAFFSVPGFTGQMLGSQVLRVLGAGVMIVTLFALRYPRRGFFLVRGDLDAPAAPVRWLGIDRPVGWVRLGSISALCISLGTLAFLLIAGRPAMASVAGMLPALPWVLALAAMNAFGEELTYRAALLAPAIGAVGARQAILLTAAFFGIGHYYGVPYGPAGVGMACLLGWFLGKCMVETKGFFWPWLIHFLQDVMIFSFMFAGAVVSGGR